MFCQSKQGAAVAGALAIATAVAAMGTSLPARAQSNVQVYGLVGTYAGSMKRSDNTARTLVLGSGGLTTSYIGFRGSEDLGGGNRAIWQLESFFQPDNGGAGRSASDPGGFSRSGWVGLQGAFGQFTAGRHTNPYYLAQQSINPFGASVVFSPLVVQSFVANFGATVIGDTVWSNALQYSTLAAGALSATVIHAMGERAGESSVNNTGLHLRYTGARLMALVSAQRVRTAAVAPSTGQDAYLAGFSYDAGMVKWYGSGQATDNDVTRIRSRTWQAGAGVPVTARGTALVSWARTNTDNPLLPDARRDTAALGYDLSLSKRTSVQSVYLYDRNQNHGSGSSFILGLRHLF